jgi:hypothetical protein
VNHALRTEASTAENSRRILFPVNGVSGVHSFVTPLCTWKRLHREDVIVPKELAEYTLSDGKSVFVEAEVPEDYSEEQVGLFDRKSKAGKPQRLADALDRVVPALGEVFTKITSLNIKPDDVELKIGIKFVGEAGVIIARASTEANLVVTLKWHADKKP